MKLAELQYDHLIIQTVCLGVMDFIQVKELEPALTSKCPFNLAT